MTLGVPFVVSTVTASSKVSTASTASPASQLLSPPGAAVTLTDETDGAATCPLVAGAIVTVMHSVVLKS